MKTKEDLQKIFQELEQQKNAILTEQIEIQGMIKLLDEQEADKTKNNE